VKISPSLMITFRNQQNRLQANVFIWLYLQQIMFPEAHPRRAQICNDLLVALCMDVYHTFHPKDFTLFPGRVCRFAEYVPPLRFAKHAK
jgi:hypothetical protein